MIFKKESENNITFQLYDGEYFTFKYFDNRWFVEIIMRLVKELLLERKIFWLLVVSSVQCKAIFFIYA